MSVAIDQHHRLQQAAAQAHSAQDHGDHLGASEAWRRYVLIEDALRDPQGLLDEGVALSKVAIDLWLQRADLVAMKRATGGGSDPLDLERLREAHGELPDGGL